MHRFCLMSVLQLLITKKLLLKFIAHTDHALIHFQEEVHCHAGQRTSVLLLQ